MVVLSAQGKKPQVTVIIPTFNGRRYIGKTIESILHQTFQDYEIIVVDDGSDEDLGHVLRPYSKSIKYVYTRNRGPAAARNLGIRLSRGKYIALMDHDDIWGIYNLNNKVGILERNTDCAMVYSYPEEIDAEGKVIEHEYPSSIPSGWVFTQFLVNNRITTFSATLIRKDIFLTVGLLDEQQIVTTCDDYDMWLKISDVSRVLFSPEKDVFYRIHDRNLLKNHNVNLNAHLHIYMRALRESKTAQIIPKNELTDIVKIHLYRIYNRFAFKYYYGKKDYTKARTLLWKCVRMQPSVVKNWVYLCICLLPPMFIDILRNMKSQAHLSFKPKTY